jgi:hypothetical protein
MNEEHCGNCGRVEAMAQHWQDAYHRELETSTGLLNECNDLKDEFKRLLVVIEPLAAKSTEAFILCKRAIGEVK